MTVEPNTALATFKSDDIITAAIYRAKGKEDSWKVLEPFLVDVYEGLLWTYNYNPKYIVEEKAFANSISAGSLNEIIESAKKAMGFKGEVISDWKVQIANRIAGELKVAMQKNVNDMAEGVEMG